MSTIQALYEIQRTQIILGYYNSASFMDPALVFSYENRIYPYFHESHLPTNADVYAGCYAIEKMFIDSVIKYITSFLEEGSLRDIPTFLELEYKFGGQREALADIIRYSFLSGCFVPDLYRKIESGCPQEVRVLTRPYARNEVFL